MLSEIQSFSKIEKELKEDYPNLNDFERLQLAIQIERNQILENGLNVSRSDKYPSSLEAISIALGFNNSSQGESITEVLKNK